MHFGDGIDYDGTDVFAGPNGRLVHIASEGGIGVFHSAVFDGLFGLGDLIGRGRIAVRESHYRADLHIRVGQQLRCHLDMVRFDTNGGYVISLGQLDPGDHIGFRQLRPQKRVIDGLGQLFLG